MRDYKKQMKNIKNKHSIRCIEATSYRKVIGKIIKLAENELKDLYPDLSRTERICIAQKEPLLSACKELREPTKKEIEQVKYNGR